MNKVYDNGVLLLGNIDMVIDNLKCQLRPSDMEEEIYSLIKDLQELKDTEKMLILYV